MSSPQRSPRASNGGCHPDRDRCDIAEPIECGPNQERRLPREASVDRGARSFGRSASARACPSLAGVRRKGIPDDAISGSPIFSLRSRRRIPERNVLNGGSRRVGRQRSADHSQSILLACIYPRSRSTFRRSSRLRASPRTGAAVPENGALLGATDGRERRNMSHESVKSGPCEFPWTFGLPCGQAGRWYDGQGPCGNSVCGESDGRLVTTNALSFATYSCAEHALPTAQLTHDSGAFFCAEHAPR